MIKRLPNRVRVTPEVEDFPDEGEVIDG